MNRCLYEGIPWGDGKTQRCVLNEGHVGFHFFSAIETSAVYLVREDWYTSSDREGVMCSVIEKREDLHESFAEFVL